MSRPGCVFCGGEPAVVLREGAGLLDSLWCVGCVNRWLRLWAGLPARLRLELEVIALDWRPG